MKLQRQKTKPEVLDDANRKSLLRIPYFVLTISLVVTIAVTYFYYTSAKTNDLQRFENRANKIKSEIRNLIETYVALLRSGRGLIYSSEKINKKEFATFVENFNLPEQYPGVLAIGYSKIFKAEEKDALIKQMKSEGIADFNLKPDTGRTEYQSIIYIEPFDERNKVALGFDMSSEPTRKQAIDTARDTGRYATSGRVILLQETYPNIQSGFLIYVPVYKTRNVPESLESKRAQIDGFIFSPFRAGDFIREVIKEGEIDEISFKVYDSEIEEKNLLAAGNESEGINDSVLQGQNEIEFGNRKWMITYTPTAKFQEQSLIWWSPIIFFMGLCISVVLFFLSLSQSRTNQNLIKTANDLTISIVMVQKLLINEKEARRVTEQLAKVKDEFLANVSHELRTPLNIINGWVNILKLGNLEKETKDKAFKAINKNLRAQANLVDQMLLFSDEDFFINSENWKIFSLSELVEECLDDFGETITERNLVVNKNLSDVLVLGDTKKLKQAISSVLDNSIKFTPLGGTISIDLKKESSLILLKIQDTGEGISKEMLPHIFEIFWQSDSSIIRKHTGLGLGLTIAKKIIEGHHGTITVKSDGLEKGASFFIQLPEIK